jgi:hypothetical protein
MANTVSGELNDVIKRVGFTLCVMISVMVVLTVVMFAVVWLFASNANAEQMVVCVPGTRCDVYAPQYHHEHPYHERCDAQCQEHRRYVEHQQWLRDHGYREYRE